MSEKKVRPWDLFNSKKPKMSDELAQQRMDICSTCEHLIQMTKQCKKCGCFMPMKTKLQDATCPIGKW